ncbi:CALB2 protein, partial [Arenaria interpres]|nr:CALB2 protein [Arenaria interpres]
GNGYIEGKELENFLQELESARKGAGVDSKKDNLGDKMKEFMHKYDKNADGKIEMAEVSGAGPPDTKDARGPSPAPTLGCSRSSPQNAHPFPPPPGMLGFLSDLLKKANRPYDEPKLVEYTQTILRMFDMNGDGKLGLSEMSR